MYNVYTIINYILLYKSTIKHEKMKTCIFLEMDFLEFGFSTLFIFILYNMDIFLNHVLKFIIYYNLLLKTSSDCR